MSAYDRLEAWLDENYYAGARDDLREVAGASARGMAARMTTSSPSQPVTQEDRNLVHRLLHDKAFTAQRVIDGKHIFQGAVPYSDVLEAFAAYRHRLATSADQREGDAGVELDGVVKRLTEIAYLDEAKALTVRAADLRAILAALSSTTGETGADDPGINRAARWHDERACQTPDVFEREFHEVSAKAIRAIRVDPSLGAMAALDIAHALPLPATPEPTTPGVVELDGDIMLLEAARDLLDLWQADQRTVGYRVDRWECLRADLDRLS